MATTLPPVLVARQGWPWTEAVDPAIYASLPRLPKVSVLVPSYNQGVFLEECLRSLLAQQYPDLEILVADGGSTDQTRAVLVHYAQNLTWAVSERDRGTWDADNKALARATGEYVIVVNSDDYLLRNGLYHLLKAVLDSPHQAWATGRVRAVNEVGETKAVFRPGPLPGAQAGRTFLHECWIYHPSTLVRRDLMAHFAETDLMDWEMWIRLERQGYLPAVTDCTVAALRFHTGAKSFDSAQIYRSQLRLLEQIAFEYADGLEAERTRTHRRMAEAEMVSLAEKGSRLPALAHWLGYGLKNPALLADRPYLGLGKRLITGQLGDLYKPMAFLDQPYTPNPDDEPCG